ncbi:MAG: hypothetical protein IPP83_00090 [Flavobacteriales bacterium]|nr:hypothetical protein [Flavobacteriales bacterium]
MDRNTVIGIVLIVAILFGYTMYTMPSKVERARATHGGQPRHGGTGPARRKGC